MHLLWLYWFQAVFIWSVVKPGRGLPQSMNEMDEAFNWGHMSTMASQITANSLFSCNQATLWMVQSVCLSVCPSASKEIYSSLKLSITLTFLVISLRNQHMEFSHPKLFDMLGSRPQWVELYVFWFGFCLLLNILDMDSDGKQFSYFLWEWKLLHTAMFGMGTCQT